ncbi:MAG: transporter [Proteobacteria bacterium]|nr:transporter [Pseudomonadota bacterium]
MGCRVVKRVIEGVVFGAVLFVSSVVWASHPVITDDAETQGKGKFQAEVNGQYDSDKETANGVTAESTGAEVMTILSYGLTDTADLVLSVPYQWGKVKEEGVTIYDEKGIADTTFEVKWRFYGKDGLMLALKPGVIFPAGNESRGLGAGKVGYQAFFIATKMADPWEFHANAGYIGNENKADEEKNIWHASLAAEYELFERLELVANIGIERNRDKTGSGNPAFLLGGIEYEVAESLSVGLGVKYGLTAAETDWSLLAGIAFGF